jgi:hypothetical protein
MVECNRNVDFRAKDAGTPLDEQNVPDIKVPGSSLA